MHLSTSSSETPLVSPKANGVLTLVKGILIVLLLLVSATEVLIRTQVIPQDTLEAHLNLLQTTTHPNAAFGDSHVARGFDVAGNFVNLAYPSENIEDMFSKISSYYETLSPGRVVIQADPHLFAAYRLNAPFQPISERAADHAPLLYITSKRHRPRLTSYWSAFFLGLGQLESKVRQTENGALLSQGDLSSLPFRKRQLEARSRLEYHALGDPVAVAAAKARYREMIAFLSKRNAEICLVSFPVSQDYLMAQARAEQQSEPAGHLNAFTFFSETALQTGARYVDARTQITQTELFRDVDHLNAEGARVFSNALISRCFEN